MVVGRERQIPSQKRKRGHGAQSRGSQSEEPQAFGVGRSFRNQMDDGEHPGQEQKRLALGPKRAAMVLRGQRKQQSGVHQQGKGQPEAGPAGLPGLFGAEKQTPIEPEAYEIGHRKQDFKEEDEIIHGVIKIRPGRRGGFDFASSATRENRGLSRRFTSPEFPIPWSVRPFSAGNPIRLWRALR